MAKKKAKKAVGGKNKTDMLLERLFDNVDTLIENVKFVLSQFEKLHDEVGTLRDDVHEMKGDISRISLRTLNIEGDVKTLKRLAQEEPEKRRVLENRIRQVLPSLPK